MEVTKVFQHGFVLLLKDFAALVVAGLIVGVLTIVTLGILGGPLTAGMIRMVLLRAREDRPPAIGDVFYFENVGRYVTAFYVLAILLTIAYMSLLVPGFTWRRSGSTCSC